MTKSIQNTKCLGPVRCGNGSENGKFSKSKKCKKVSRGHFQGEIKDSAEIALPFAVGTFHVLTRTDTALDCIFT